MFALMNNLKNLRKIELKKYRCVGDSEADICEDI